MLRLMYMAREFRIAATSLTNWLMDAYYHHGIRSNKLQAELSETITNIGEEYAMALYQDLLEVITGCKEGECYREALLDILTEPEFAGEKFVRSYQKFVRKRLQAENELQRALNTISDKYQNLDFKNAVRMQNYNNRLNLQILSIGAINNAL